MPKLFDIMAPMGQYTDPQSGQEKTRWLKCGAVIQTAAGKTAIKLDAVPIAPPADQSGEGGMWLQCFEPRDPNQQQQGGGQGFRQNPQPQAPAPVPYTDPNFQGNQAPAPQAQPAPAPQQGAPAPQNPPQGNNPPW